MQYYDYNIVTLLDPNKEGKEFIHIIWDYAKHAIKYFTQQIMAGLRFQRYPLSFSVVLPFHIELGIIQYFDQGLDFGLQ